MQRDRALPVLLEPAHRRDPILALIRQEGQQVRHGLLQLWVAKLWSYLSQRRQNKAALRQGRMRQRQLLPGDDGIPQQQQIEVQGAWAFGDTLTAIAPEFPFDGQQSLEQGQRLQFRLQREDRIQEGGLIVIAHGLSLV